MRQSAGAGLAAPGRETLEPRADVSGIRTGFSFRSSRLCSYSPGWKKIESSTAIYWLVMVAIVPSNLVMLIVNGSL